MCINIFLVLHKIQLSQRNPCCIQMWLRIKNHKNCTFHNVYIVFINFQLIFTRPSVCLSVCPDVRHTPVLCLAERKQDPQVYTIW